MRIHFQFNLNTKTERMNSPNIDEFLKSINGLFLLIQISNLFFLQWVDNAFSEFMHSVLVLRLS